MSREIPVKFGIQTQRGREEVGEVERGWKVATTTKYIRATCLLLA
jgi:hypothetical protein